MSTNRITEILARASIVAVWTALGGDTPRYGRAPAFWRKTKDRNISLNDGKGVWFDHARNEGGGVLALVERVKGGTRQDALRWLADLAGVPLVDRPLTPAERRDYARRRAIAEAEARDLLAWRTRLIGALLSYRDETFKAYHRALRHILAHGLDSLRGELAADVVDTYEVRYQDLDRRLDVLRKARFGALLPHFRAARERRLAA
ncbi:MAG: hypothetical protein AAB654_11135 [Acidobacteriota bacterium]